MSAAADDVLVTSLEFAVPLHMLEVRDLPEAERYRLAREASAVVGAQGDTLMYGSAGTRFGSGAKEMAKHRAHGDAKAGECAGCDKGKDLPRCCMRRFCGGCHVCSRGQATYSAGEVFSFLARGLAIAACQPGGVTFAGLHWCGRSHPCCPNVRAARRPGCCTCTDGCLLVTPCSSRPDGSECADGCRWCENGCAPEPCCAVALQPAGQEPAPAARRRVEEAAIAGGAL